MKFLLLHGAPLGAEGTAMYVRNLARAMRAATHDVTVACPRAPGDVLVDDIEQAGGRVWPLGIEAPSGPARARMEALATQSAHELRAAAVALTPAVRDCLQHNPSHLVVVDDLLLLGLVTAAEARRVDRRCVAVSLSTDIERGARTSAALRAVARETVSLVSACVTLSPQLRIRAAEALGVPVDAFRVVAPGIDDGAFACPLFRDRDAHIVMVGELAVERGPHLLVAALLRALSERRDLRVTFVGEGPDRSLIEALVGALDAGDEGRVAVVLSRLGTTAERARLVSPVVPELLGHGAGHRRALARDNFARRVRFAGWLAPDMLGAHVASARLLVCPSLVEQSLPVSLLEGLAAGCFLAVTPIGGAADVLDWAVSCCPEVAAGWRIDLDDPVGSLALSILTGIESWDIGISCQLSALVRARHTWRAAVKRFGQLAARVEVDRRSRPRAVPLRREGNQASGGR